MFLDCDDLVHHRLAEYVACHPGVPGWFFPRGYLHTTGTRYVQLIEPNFHLKCGSWGIVRGDLLPVPTSLSIDATKDRIIAAVDEERLYRLFATHGQWDPHLEAAGLRLVPLPFPGAVWQIGTGENASGNLVSSRRRERISPEITEAFGLRRPSPIASAVRTGELAVRRVVRRLGSRGRPSGRSPRSG